MKSINNKFHPNPVFLGWAQSSFVYYLTLTHDNYEVDLTIYSYFIASRQKLRGSSSSSYIIYLKIDKN